MRSLQQSDYQLHYEIWQQVMSSTGPTDRAAAVAAVNQLYAIEKRAHPAVIFCQSPFQMALLPGLLNDTLASEKWRQIRQRFDRLDGDEEWEQVWLELWMESLMGTVENLLLKEVPNF